MKKKSTIKIRAKKIARFHSVLSLGLFFAYALFSLLYSPKFFFSDVQNKFHALADTVTVSAVVLPPPAKPVATATAVCDADSGTLSVELDWADDDGTSSWDIDRESSPLVSGLTDSSYSDTNVSVGTTYTYTVTANGPMGPGVSVSDPVAVTTPSTCAESLPAPTVAITLFNGKSTPRETSTTDRTPDFEGTTNMPGAAIAFYIDNQTDIYAQISANANGYWQWTAPTKLSYGTHTLIVTATDPSDASRSAQTSYTFKVKKESENDEEDEKESSTASGSTAASAPSQQQPTPAAPDESPAPPLDFTLAAPNEVVQGKPLLVSVSFTSVEEMYIGMDAILRYSVIAKDGNEKAEFLRDIILRPQALFADDIELQKFLEPGEYRIRAEVIFSSYNVSRETVFSMLPLPVLDFGGTTEVTYPEMLSMMGTISLWLLLLLLAWTALFFREYWLSMHAVRQITGRHLAWAGFLGRRKGVRK